jgi:hypothetical protein
LIFSDQASKRKGNMARLLSSRIFGERGETGRSNAVVFCGYISKKKRLYKRERKREERKDTGSSGGKKGRGRVRLKGRDARMGR